MCRPGSGSFVRHKKVDVGVTFLQAVKHRYGAEAGATTLGGMADDCNDAEEEMYVVGESNRITKVHMVGKDKITEKFRYTYMYICTNLCSEFGSCTKSYYEIKSRGSVLFQVMYQILKTVMIFLS